MQNTLSPSQLLSVADTYGLPLFVYDATSIERQITVLQNAFDVPSMEIRYACKALTTLGILKEIYRHGCGIDTVSPGELTIALRAGIPPSQISFTPSGVLEEEYAFAIEQGVHVHVDQVETLKWLDQHYPGLSVTLRFNPAVEAGGHSKVQVGAEGSKFGFLTKQVDDIVALTRKLSLRITGVHMHLGSDIGDSSSFDQAYDYLLSVSKNWVETLERVDLGGGFKIPYHPGDHAIDMDAFGKKVSHRFNQFCREIGKPITLVFEPGKFLVSAAGCLLMEVSQVRETADHPLAYVSTGFNHFLRPMNYGAYHHIINLSNPEGPLVMYDVVGYLCETDTFASRRQLHQVRKGDILCLLNAGAYGYSMASNYNSRPRPAEVLISQDGNPILIRRAESIDDLLKTDLAVQ
jgi:diaminopimelate decarboxylase